MVEFFDPQISIAIDLLRAAKNVVALTGAGISTESGISDFRSPGGLWEKYNPLVYANYAVFLKDPRYYWQLEYEIGPLYEKAKPNRAHKALVDLEKKGKLKAIITQNIDNFHQEAGSKAPIIELHGNAQQASCMDCEAPIKRSYITKQLHNGVRIPACPKCGGRIKTHIVLFNEPVAEDLLEEAMEYAEHCEILLILGSSLTVSPANQIPLITRKAGGKLIFINQDPTYMDRYATLRIIGNLGTILPMIVGGV